MHLHICWSIAWRDSRSPLEIWLIHFDDAARTLEVLHDGFGRTLTHRCHAMREQTTGMSGIDGYY